MLKNKSIILVLFSSITLLACTQSQNITKEPTKLVNIEKKIVLSKSILFALIAYRRQSLL